MKCLRCKTKDNLHKNTTSSNGTIFFMCRKCTTNRIKKYRKTKTGKEKIYKAVYKSIAKYPEKQKARLKLFYKIKIGKILKPEKCELCLKNKDLVGHHTDYSKPLDVNWVCRNCHNSLHNI